MTQSTRIPRASDRATNLLNLWHRRTWDEFGDRLEDVKRSTPSELADTGEQERLELLAEVAHELRSRPHASMTDSDDLCHSLLRHLTQESTTAKRGRIALVTTKCRPSRATLTC
jgi:hypothetical protein